MSGAESAPEPTPPGRARDATTRAADRVWAIARRIHLGTRRPGNWLQLFKFGVVGASGYVVNLIVFAALTQAIDVHHIPAAIVAFAVAVTNNFLWNRHWTFQATEGHAGFQAMRFFVISVGALGVNLIVLEILIAELGVSEIPAQAIAVAFAMPVNFIGNKLWTFGGG
jgi:putative flippase GtrA